MSPRTSRGFTLIELLVVISVVALLISILLPALAKARNAAQLTQSMSSVRQIQIAVHTYATDEKGRMPFPVWPDPTGTIFPGYSGPYARRAYGSVLFARQYVNSPQIFWSSARDTSNLNFATLKSNLGNAGWNLTGYGLNGWGGWQGGKNHLPNLDDPKAPSPGRMISLSEGFSGAAAQLSGYYAVFGWRRDFSNPNVQRLFTYDGRAVRSYHDGHAEGGDGRAIGWDASLPVAPGPVTIKYVGPYAGDWTYTGANEFLNHAPWYTGWLTNGIAD